MSLLNTPLWQDLGGNPRTGVHPPTLVMCSGRLTPQRHGEIQQIYMRFSLAKLTAVGEFFVFNRVLSDGTRVRLESMQGKDRVFVWAADIVEDDEFAGDGWCFTPANDQNLSGFVRRPGAAPGSLSASAFQGVGSNGSGGKPVFTFVSKKTGGRKLCTPLEGGSRMWRSTKAHTKGGDPETLTFDHQAVYVSGSKAVMDFAGSTGSSTHIEGAAIAKRGAEKWLVFITSNRLGAIRLRDLKPTNTNFVDCGSAFDPDKYVFTRLTLWEFSPDGMNAIAMGGRYPMEGFIPVTMNAVYRVKLIAQNGTIPFRVEASEELKMDAGIKKRVISTFHFNEASRNFEFIGWGNFTLSKHRDYSAFVPTGFTGGWGPSISQSEVGFPDKYYEISGRYYDPLISIAPVIYPGSPISAEIVDPASWRPLEDPVVFRDLPKNFGNDNDVAPDSFLYTRELVSGGAGNIPPTPDGYARRHVPALGGWLIESGPVLNMVSFMEETVGTPDSRTFRYSSTHVGLVVRQRITRDHETESFETLEDVGSYCDANWGMYSGPDRTITEKILDNYRPVMNLRFTGFLDMYEKLEDLKFNLIESKGGKSTGAYAAKTSYLNLINATVSDEQPNAPVTRVTEEWGTYTREDNGVVTEEEYLSYRLKVDEWTSFPSFVFSATILSSPIYKHNYTTDWVLTSQIYLSGKSYVAAGYDSQGQERFLYFEADETKRLLYNSSALGRDVPAIDLAWSFSGGFGYDLKIDDTVIDSCSYSVSDSVRVVDGAYAPGENESGNSPVIQNSEISVQDFDLSIGHVLYRKDSEAFTVREAQSTTRPAVLNSTHSYFLRTPTTKHQIGGSVEVSSDRRPVKDGFKHFSNTKKFFRATAPSFFPVPNSISINGGYVDDWLEGFGSLVPQSQRAGVGPKSGVIESMWERRWVSDMMIYYPGTDQQIYPVPRKLTNPTAFLIDATEEFGKFIKPPQSNLKLRAFNDDCWMVCFQQEMYIQSTANENTTARYFLKLAKNKPVVEFDAATYFPYLGASKKLLAPKFHFRKRT